MDTTTLGPHEMATDTRGGRISPRHHRSVQENRRLVAESLVPGASVAEVARRHGVVTSELLQGLQPGDRAVCRE
jgi:transposase-like protein